MTQKKWPSEILVVRHGQSAANVARDLAEQQGLSDIGVSERDMDVSLSTIGQHQSSAFGIWYRQEFKGAPPVLFSSPYTRTQQTLQIALETDGKPKKTGQKLFFVDERVREREFGLITGLTRKGIQEKFPQEVVAYDQIKKFYYRPPGGESWCDVILRVRSFITMLQNEYAGKKILIVAHTVVVYAFRYVLENLTENEILAIDKAHDLANCSVTSFIANEDGQGMRLDKFNFIEHLKDLNEPVTRKSDVPKI